MYLRIFSWTIIAFLAFLLLNPIHLMSQKTPHELNPNYSARYTEVIAFYSELARESAQVTLQTFGMTDVGEPLHELILSKDGISAPNQIGDRAVLFINNGIHPGEPCGVDASMAFARDILADGQSNLLNNLVIVIVPMYNIGGSLNRNSTTRVNQVGPDTYGFRGNARNFDLNRDFVKCDTRNAQSFNQLFNRWSPEILVDTHTSNGADYQYTMTLISTMADKLEPSLKEILNNDLNPYLYQDMEKRGWPMCPYVETKGATPETGLVQFVDYPRYSSGYAALHHTIAFMPETHMLKPFADRVTSTYAFLLSITEWMHNNSIKIKSARKTAQSSSWDRNTEILLWDNDFDRQSSFKFKGYESGYKPSTIHGKDRLYYDRNKPYEKDIPYYNFFKPTLEIKVPRHYIIPQAYQDVIDRLKWNGVEMSQLAEDQSFDVQLYKIDDVKSTPTAYEGHFLHTEVTVDTFTSHVQYRKGDYLISTDQDARTYLVHTIEPQATDSYFAWNFFDGILQRKEGFSPYVWEDLADNILNNNPKLKAEFERAKKDNPSLVENPREALLWIYFRSPYYEKTHRVYPVGRMF